MELRRQVTRRRPYVGSAPAEDEIHRSCTPLVPPVRMRPSGQGGPGCWSSPPPDDGAVALPARARPLTEDPGWSGRSRAMRSPTRTRSVQTVPASTWWCHGPAGAIGPVARFAGPTSCSPTSACIERAPVRARPPRTADHKQDAPTLAPAVSRLPGTVRGRGLRASTSASPPPRQPRRRVAWRAARCPCLACFGAG